MSALARSGTEITNVDVQQQRDGKLKHAKGARAQAETKEQRGGPSKFLTLNHTWINICKCSKSLAVGLARGM